MKVSAPQGAGLSLLLCKSPGERDFLTLQLSSWGTLLKLLQQVVYKGPKGTGMLEGRCPSIHLFHPAVKGWGEGVSAR